ncbi:pilus assembly PilX family protein [Piscinibacter sp.]|uniref:pilus assembly PilX family protein n=1 Tax=Piscinibacter sp. TaxID=1903157 RepID=UPI002C71FE3D|nr:PilX N-terminal domain-containing pilus assembly protein [Albitalea sp.]HUG22272.1 PilX N-terminal domain-containing pilus assembly protein [Albitalea sp.]
MKPFTGPRQQQGATLIVALVMLLALSMLAVWSFNTSTTNMRVVGNMQARQESLTAAQTAVEQVISSTLFIQDPAGVAASLIDVDVDGDTVADYQAELTPAPACYRVKAVMQNELDTDVEVDRNCLDTSALRTPGIEGPSGGGSTGESICSDTEWNIRVEVTDPRSGASVAVNQGVATRVMTAEAANACP